MGLLDDLDGIGDMNVPQCSETQKEEIYRELWEEFNARYDWKAGNLALQKEIQQRVREIDLPTNIFSCFSHSFDDSYNLSGKFLNYVIPLIQQRTFVCPTHLESAITYFGNYLEGTPESPYILSSYNYLLNFASNAKHIVAYNYAYAGGMGDCTDALLVNVGDSPYLYHNLDTFVLNYGNICYPTNNRNTVFFNFNNCYERRVRTMHPHHFNADADGGSENSIMVNFGNLIHYPASDAFFPSVTPKEADPTPFIRVAKSSYEAWKFTFDQLPQSFLGKLQDYSHSLNIFDISSIEHVLGSKTPAQFCNDFSSMVLEELSSLMTIEAMILYDNIPYHKVKEYQEIITRNKGNQASLLI